MAAPFHDVRTRPPLSRRLTMVGDPFTNKKTVRIVAIVDLGLAGLLLLFAAYRLVANDFRAQSLIVFIGARESEQNLLPNWLVADGTNCFVQV